MKKLIFFLAMMMPMGIVMAQDDNTEKLWYDTPAKIWLEALPIGNSHLGAMVYGGIQAEEIQLNEETFWSGGPHNNNSKTSLNYLDKVRDLIFSGKESEAETLINNQFVKGPHGMRYLTLGSLKITNMGFSEKNVTDYRRELDLKTALSKVTFKVKDGEETYNCSRTTFASMADGVIVMQLESDRDMSFMIQHSCTFNTTYKKDMGGIVATIQGVSQEGVDSKLKAQCVFKVECDGKVTTNGTSGITMVRETKKATLTFRQPPISSSMMMCRAMLLPRTRSIWRMLPSTTTRSCWLVMWQPIRSNTIGYTSPCLPLPIATFLPTSA